MGDSVYIFTDGLIDQNDAEGNRFGSQKLKELIQKYHYLPMSKQKEIFSQEFDRYLQGQGVIQRDDVTLLGVRL
jgi:serine phosphatase RsbU (regulator of sigma subunit)